MTTRRSWMIGLPLTFVLASTAYACGSEEGNIPNREDDGGSATAKSAADPDGGGGGDGASGSSPEVTECASKGGRCEPCGGCNAVTEQVDRDASTSCPSIPGSGCPGAPACCMPKPDAGTPCDVVGARCCDPFPGDGPNYCKNDLKCCGDGRCGATCT